MFEEAIATANLLLQGGQQIAQTVRTAAFVDNTWKVRPSLRQTCMHMSGSDANQLLSLCHRQCYVYSGVLLLVYHRQYLVVRA